MMNLKTTKFVDHSVVIQICIGYMLFAHDLVPINPMSPKCEEIVVVMLELSTMFFKQNMLLNSIVATPR